MARLRNTYSVENFVNLAACFGINPRASIEQVLEAYGTFNEPVRGLWVGGFLVKMQKSSGYPELAHLYLDAKGNHLDTSTHVLDFPNLPENTDKDPFTLNEYIDGEE